jgi:hypothetical protein
MAEMVFDKIQFGRQSAYITAVAATTVFPGKATAFDLDRGYLNPDEDFGRLDDEAPGRGSWGVRGASWQIAAPLRFQDYMHIPDMHLAVAGAPSGVGPYTYTHTSDSTSLTPKPYTIEMGSEDALDQWEIHGCLATEVSLGFDELSAPGNAPWMWDVTGIGIDRAIAARTAALSPPATLETAEGHLTLLKEGTTGTAFGSLAELATSLKMFRLTSSVPYTLRAHGSATDLADSYGVSGRAGITFTAGIKIGSTAKTDTHDIYNVAGSVITERRWRMLIDGSGNNVLTIDARVRFRVVSRTEHEGQALYGLEGSFVYDATLGGRIQIIGVNDVASIP